MTALTHAYFNILLSDSYFQQWKSSKWVTASNNFLWTNKQHVQFSTAYLGRIQDFLKEGMPKLRTDRTSSSVGTDTEKTVIFKVNSHDLVHAFCLGCPHEVRHLIFAKKKEGACTGCTPLWIHPSCLSWKYAVTSHPFPKWDKVYLLMITLF